MAETKRPRGRPPKPMPEPIPDTPENVLKALLRTPPKKRDEWKYQKDQDSASDRSTKD